MEKSQNYKPGAHVTFIYRIAEKNQAIKLPTSSDSLQQKTCELKNCKGYKTRKICSRCGKYVCCKRTFDNKIICKKMQRS